MNKLQVGLDLVGLIPVVGEVAAGLNGIIYAARGDKLYASLSFAAMIPVAGNAATAGKWINKGANATKDIAAGVKNANKSAGTVGKNTPSSNSKQSNGSKPPAKDSKPVEATKGKGNVKRIPETEVKFNYNPKHDSAEFTRQLKAQEEGMNKLTVDEYLKNRQKYIDEGRAVEGNLAQQAAREQAYTDKVIELREKGLSSEAE